MSIRAAVAADRFFSLASLSALIAILAACGGDPDPEVAPTPPSTEPIPVNDPSTPTNTPAARPGPLCTYHGFCWHSPFPQGNSLHAVHALAANEVYAVGDRGTVIRFDGNHWTIEDTPTRERLLGVGGVAADSLWIVGTHGTLLHRTPNTGWVTVATGTEATLHAVIARSANEAFAVGDDGLVLRWDGQAWTREPSGADRDLVSVAMSLETLYALGRATDDEPNAVVFERGPEGWRQLEDLEGDNAAITVAADGLLVAGIDAQHQASVDTFVRERLRDARPINGLYSGGGLTFAVGYRGTVAIRQEARWTVTTLDSEPDLIAVSGTSPTDVWAVGMHGALVHYDGSAWTPTQTGTTAALRSVFARARDDVYAVGSSAMLHYDGRNWRTEGLQTFDLRAIAGADRFLFAAGDDGVLLRSEGEAGFFVEHQGGGYELTSLFVDVRGTVIAGGKTTWIESNAGLYGETTDRPSITGLYGAAPNDLWAVGQGGLQHFDGTAWTAVEGQTDRVLFGIFGLGPNDIYAVGAGGAVMHYDGRAWSALEVPTRENLLSVWASSPTDVYAVGQHGTIVHFDGTAWRWRDSGTDQPLQSVYGTGADDLFVVGQNGTILHYEGTTP